MCFIIMYQSLSYTQAVICMNLFLLCCHHFFSLGSLSYLTVSGPDVALTAWSGNLSGSCRKHWHQCERIREKQCHEIKTSFLQIKKCDSIKTVSLCLRGRLINVYLGNLVLLRTGWTDMRRHGFHGDCCWEERVYCEWGSGENCRGWEDVSLRSVGTNWDHF